MCKEILAQFQNKKAQRQLKIFYHLVHLFSLLVSYLLSFIDQQNCQILFKFLFYFGVKHCLHFTWIVWQLSADFTKLIVKRLSR